MKKDRFDPDKMANELAGASAFFRQTSQTPPATTPPVAPVETIPTPDIAATNDVVTSRRHSVTTSPDSPTNTTDFDINRETASRDSLRLSVDETKALEALRITLKWDHDLTISKNDICRVALHHLLEDFAAKGDKSQAVVRLRRKRSSR